MNKMKKKKMMEKILYNQEYIKMNLDFMYKKLMEKLLETREMVTKMSFRVLRE